MSILQKEMRSKREHILKLDRFKDKLTIKPLQEELVSMNYVLKDIDSKQGVTYNNKSYGAI